MPREPHLRKPICLSGYSQSLDRKFRSERVAWRRLLSVRGESRQGDSLLRQISQCDRLPITCNLSRGLLLQRSSLRRTTILLPTRRVRLRGTREFVDWRGRRRAKRRRLTKESNRRLRRKKRSLADFHLPCFRSLPESRLERNLLPGSLRQLQCPVCRKVSKALWHALPPPPLRQLILPDDQSWSPACPLRHLLPILFLHHHPLLLHWGEQQALQQWRLPLSSE